MSKKKKALLIGLAAIFILYLATSNMIAALFIPQDRRMDKIELGEFAANDELLFCLEDNQYAGDRMETAMFRGWAFVKGGTGEGKTIRIVFKSKNITYRSQEAELNASSEVNSVLSEFQPAGKVAFTAYLSTMSMKNGDYEMFVEYEEDGAVSLINTGETFKKSGVNWYNTTAYDYVEPLAYEDDEQVFAVLAPIVEQGKTLKIEGSAYAPGIDSTKNKLYASLQFADGTERWYPLNVKNSLDAARNAQHINALHSAFSMRLSSADMPKGDIIVRLVVQNAEVCKRSGITAAYTYE